MQNPVEPGHMHIDINNAWGELLIFKSLSKSAYWQIEQKESVRLLLDNAELSVSKLQVLYSVPHGNASFCSGPSESSLPFVSRTEHGFSDSRKVGNYSDTLNVKYLNSLWRRDWEFCQQTIQSHLFLDSLHPRMFKKTLLI